MSSNDNVKIAAAAGAGVVAVGGAAVVGKKLLSKSPEQHQQALAEKSMETDKVLFHMFPRAAFSPSHSPYCTCVEAYFRANKIPYEVCEPDLQASPNGCVPYIAYRGQVIADSQKIMQWASIQFNITTDVSLSRDMQAESKAIRSMIEYSFMPALVRSEFVDNKLRAAGPFMSNSRIVRWFAARAMKSYVTGSQDVSGYSLYDKDQYENLLMQDVQAVETILRDRPFLVGQAPTMVDCTAYSMFIMVFLLHDRQPSRHPAVAAAAVPEDTQAPHPQQERQTEPFTGEEPFLHPEGTEAAAAAADAIAKEDGNAAAAAEDLFVNAPLDYMVHSQPIRDYMNRMTEVCYPDMEEILPPPAFAAAEAKAAAKARAAAEAQEAAEAAKAEAAKAEAEGPVDRDIDALTGQIESIKQSFEHAPAGAVRSLSIHQEEEKTAADRKAAWDRIREILPRKKTPEDKKRRIALFKKFDVDGSKSLTIQETYQGLIDHCQLDEFTTRLKDITLRAFNKAKSLGTKDRNAGDEDQVEFLEFRLMLCYIYDYFELTVMFDEIDADGSMMIDEQEFKEAVPRIAEWGVQINDPEATFREVDANGSGKMTFDEFCSWASAAKLDADGDPDNTAGPGEVPAPAEEAPVAAARGLPEEKTAEERKTAWDRIREILPRKKTPEDKKRRIALFKKFDADGSKSLTLDETYQGLIDHCQLDEFTTRLKDICKRAFNKAKSLGTKDRNAGDEDQVEFLEFRLMLCYIYDYFELTVMFDEIDADGSMMIDMDEFKAAVPRIAEWGVQISDPEATFREVDANGSGKMTFDEFCSWASAAKLDADGDPDNTEGGASPNAPPA